MAFHKGKEKLKAITVEDIAYKNSGKNKVYMQGPPTEGAPLLTTQPVFMDNDEGRVLYNEMLLNLDPDYAKLRPVGSYIVRMFVLTKSITPQGLLILPNTKVMGQSHSGFKKIEVTDPYQFHSKAVIVAVPEFEKEIEPGMVVQIVKPRTILQEDQVVGYEYEYAHPDYLLPQVPLLPSDKHFGYAIIPRTSIKVIVQ